MNYLNIYTVTFELTMPGGEIQLIEDKIAAETEEEAHSMFLEHVKSRFGAAFTNERFFETKDTGESIWVR